jgi:outer membrane receptor protein involved in Fe transport
MSKLHGRFLLRFSAVGAIELVTALTAPPPAPASAQETAQLLGIVAEEGTGRPVRSAVVTLVGTNIQARSGPDGSFTLSDVRVGPMIVRVQAPGYPTVVDEVSVTPGAVVVVQLLLPRPAAILDEILVTGSRRPEPSEGSARTAADLVARHVPYLQPFTSSFNSTRGRAFNPLVQLRGPTSLNSDGEPVIVLDGVRMSGLGRAMDALRQIPASQIKEIQILRGPSSAHLFGSPAGVISIRTVSGKP